MEICTYLLSWFKAAPNLQGHRECANNISLQTLAWTAMPLRFRQCTGSHGSERPPHQRPSWVSDRWRALAVTFHSVLFLGSYYFQRSLDVCFDLEHLLHLFSRSLLETFSLLLFLSSISLWSPGWQRAHSLRGSDWP